LQLRGNRLAGVQPGLGATDLGVCYLTTRTLARLVRRELSVVDSIDRGRLVLEAPAGRQRELLAAFEQVVSSGQDV
jgi:hypothetical protein